MHVYIYDSYLNHSKYQKVLAKIETRITDLGLNGKISRLGVMKNYMNTVEEELKRGAKTIVAVGNNETVCQVLAAMVDTEVPLGIIPIGNDNNSISEALGIEQELEACDILSARRIERVDLGLANGVPFLTEAVITSKGTVIEINQDYSIEIMEKGEIKVINLPLSRNGLPELGSFTPQDGQMELYIETETSKNFLKKISGKSFFTFERMTIENNNHELLLDNTTKIKPPVEVSLLKQSLNIIVGKNRNF